MISKTVGVEGFTEDDMVKEIDILRMSKHKLERIKANYDDVDSNSFNG